MNDSSPARHREPWISRSWLVIGALIVALVVAVLAVANAFTDRLTVHNRTTVPIQFMSDALGGFPNYVPACAEVEFVWDPARTKPGWIPPDGQRRRQAGAVLVEIPEVRGFEGPSGGSFAVVVTSAGVREMEPESSRPPCAGTPPD